MNNNPTGPSWPINNDDKKIIREFGRELMKFVLEYSKTHSVNGTFHAKYVSGGFQYVEMVMGEKSRVVSEDILLLQDTVERFKLGDQIEEPFQPKAEKTRAELRAEAEARKAQAEEELKVLDDVEKSEATPSSATAAPILSPVQPGAGPEAAAA